MSKRQSSDLGKTDNINDIFWDVLLLEALCLLKILQLPSIFVMTSE